MIALLASDLAQGRHAPQSPRIPLTMLRTRPGRCHQSLPGQLVERVTRIELALSAWEAEVLPLNYTRMR